MLEKLGFASAFQLWDLKEVYRRDQDNERLWAGEEKTQMYTNGYQL